LKVSVGSSDIEIYFHRFPNRVAQKLIFNSYAGRADEFEICFVPTSNERLTTPSFALSSEQ